MTLDEAIAHAYEQAATISCKECAAEHLQLGKWLTELKQYREMAEDEIHSYRDTRRAINDFLGR